MAKGGEGGTQLSLAFFLRGATSKQRQFTQNPKQHSSRAWRWGLQPSKQRRLLQLPRLRMMIEEEEKKRKMKKKEKNCHQQQEHPWREWQASPELLKLHVDGVLDGAALREAPSRRPSCELLLHCSLER